jgi:hypothetical protein
VHVIPRGHVIACAPKTCDPQAWRVSTFQVAPQWDNAYVLYVEGIDPGGTKVTVTLDPSGDGSGPLTHDTVYFTVVMLDIDVDSDNDGTLSESPLEDAIEDRAGSGPGQVGKRIFLNSDDDNKNGRPDMFDSRADYLTPDPEVDDFHDKDFAEVRLKAFALDELKGRGYTLWLAVPKGLKVWLDDQKKPLWEAEPGKRPDEDLSINVPREPVAGKPKYDETRGTWYVWPIDKGQDFPDTLYVEGPRSARSKGSSGVWSSRAEKVRRTPISSNAIPSRLRWRRSCGRAMKPETIGSRKPHD